MYLTSCDYITPSGIKCKQLLFDAEKTDLSERLCQWIPLGWEAVSNLAKSDAVTKTLLAEWQME